MIYELINPWSYSAKVNKLLSQSKEIHPLPESVIYDDVVKKAREYTLMCFRIPPQYQAILWEKYMLEDKVRDLEELDPNFYQPAIREYCGKLKVLEKLFDIWLSSAIQKSGFSIDTVTVRKASIISSNWELMYLNTVRRKG